MKASSVTCVTIFVFLMTSALSSAYNSKPKLRRNGVLGLYPYPRVGRASHNTWDLPLGPDQPYHDRFADYEQIGKRQLYAFPRVGKSDPHYKQARNQGLYLVDGRTQEPYQRSGRDPMMLRDNRDQMQSSLWRNDGPGMWFGPRLGRSVRDDDDTSINSHEEIESEGKDSESLERTKREIQLS